MTTNRKCIKSIITEYLSDAYEIPEYKITEETNLRSDLNLDSLCYAELAYELSNRLLLAITTGDLEHVDTVKDLIDMCDNKEKQDRKIQDARKIWSNRVYN